MKQQLFRLQRLSALVLAPLVIIHLALILYAVGDGLSAEEILNRTRGNLAWAAFYTVFVLAAAIHAPIGVRNILREWTSLPARATDVVCIVLALTLLLTGMRAVAAVY
ncbi:MAG: succinate dehydrogenase [Gammaproteobacteria bacterium]|nr:succinate dehydrogenase [Gammaproteobacteria bacterium]